MSAADHATSRGQDLADRLVAACGLAENAPLPGARELPVLTGLTQECALSPAAGERPRPGAADPRRQRAGVRLRRLRRARDGGGPGPGPRPAVSRPQGRVLGPGVTGQRVRLRARQVHTGSRAVRPADAVRRRPAQRDPHPRGAAEDPHLRHPPGVRRAVRPPRAGLAPGVRHPGPRARHRAGPPRGPRPRTCPSASGCRTTCEPCWATSASGRRPTWPTRSAPC